MSGAAPERPNIRQVAAVAGVSHMTVSRVINNHPSIRPETKQRVLDAIQELNFRPNNAARALASSKSRRFGVIIEGSFEYGPAGMMQGVEVAARAAGYFVTSVGLRDDEITPQDAVKHLTDQGVDAVCVIAPRSASVASLRKIQIGVPVLVIKADADPTFLTTSLDQKQGSEMVVDHLAELGHRDVLHLSGPLDWLDARARERAYHFRRKEWGMRERPIVVGDWTADFAYDFAKGLHRRPDYTAIYAGNDEMALGLIHGFHERGIDVPGELSIVGFDDLPLAAHFLPPLTTVRQDFRALGQKAVEVLKAAAEGGEIPQRTKLGVELKVRASTAPPREGALP